MTQQKPQPRKPKELIIAEDHLEAVLNHSGHRPKKYVIYREVLPDSGDVTVSAEDWDRLVALMDFENYEKAFDLIDKIEKKSRRIERGE